MIFSVQRYLEDYINRCGFDDADQYAISLANLYDRKRAGMTGTAFLAAMRRLRTVFYKRNESIKREAFERKVLGLLDTRFKKKDFSSSHRKSPPRLNRQLTA